MVVGVRTPAVVIAAPSSGSGKTTVTTGLIGALRRAGLSVAPFKVGPDFIDPGYHTVAAGRPGRNLDPNLVGTELIAPLFAHGCRGADIAVVEGVMGLFDGRIATEGPMSGGFGSTAQVAAILGAPVVLVVDAAGHSQSLAALLHGFATFDTSVSIAGVVLNRVGSPRHEAVLRAACAQVGVPVLGAIRRDAALAVPSRHLGLIPAAERAPQASQAVESMATAIGAALDLTALEATARRRDRADGTAWSATDALGADVIGSDRPAVAVAGGRAFTFGYAEHAELLAAAGAQVLAFDPLHDRLPDDVDAVVIGGGFPEEHAEQLASNTALRADLREHARRGGLVHAECAGYVYLCAALDDQPMVGILDATASFTSSLTLGYRDAVCLHDNALYRAGERVTGHEFHRSTVRGAGTAAWGWRTDAGSTTDGVVTGGVHGSYLHVHPAGVPQAISRFVAAAARFRAARRGGEPSLTG